MINTWREPTEAEAALGYVAMILDVYYCQTERGLLAINYTGGYTDKETKTVYPRKAHWTGYTAERLERRAKWGGDMPSFLDEERIAA